jgi:hypothetical protein
MNSSRELVAERKFATLFGRSAYIMAIVFQIQIGREPTRSLIISNIFDTPGGTTTGGGLSGASRPTAKIANGYGSRRAGRKFLLT